MSEHDHDHDHGEHNHSMPVYQFLGNIFAEPLEDTLLFNVGDPGFWAELRPKLENERTHDALDKLEAAAEAIAAIPEDRRKMILTAEYAQTFLLPDAPMPPLERAYGLDAELVHEIACNLGVQTSIQRFLPDDHIANELFMLVPIDYGQHTTQDQLQLLADYFLVHPILLLRNMIENAGDTVEGTGFYKAITEFALAWLQWDLDAFEGE